MSDIGAADPGPLAEVHDGSVVSEWTDLGGRRTPARYGPVESEYRTVGSGVGRLDRSAYDVLVLTGADRIRFLSGLVTCAVAAIEPGEVRYGFFTSVKGRILADVVVLAGADRLLLELPPGRGAAIAEHLRRYRIADRVEIEEASLVPLTLVGPDAAMGTSVEGVSAEDWTVRFEGVEAGCVAVDRRPVLGIEAVTCWVEAREAPALWARFGEDVAAVGWDAIEIHRVERGRPRFGADFGPDVFPQETGLETHAVSYEKGCYLGQEVVARIHYRGRVNRRITGLLVDGDEVPSRGSAVLHDGRSAGEITSAVRSLELGRLVALSLLHRRATEPGTVVELEDGPRAEVTSLPFVGSDGGHSAR